MALPIFTQDIESFFFSFYVTNLLDGKIDIIEFELVVPQIYICTHIPGHKHNLIKTSKDESNGSVCVCIWMSMHVFKHVKLSARAALTKVKRCSKKKYLRVEDGEDSNWAIYRVIFMRGYFNSNHLFETQAHQTMQTKRMKPTRKKNINFKVNAIKWIDMSCCLTAHVSAGCSSCCWYTKIRWWNIYSYLK